MVFDDVEKTRARDLASMLVAHGRVNLATARAELEDAYADACVIIERLEHARADVLLWSEMLQDACILRAVDDPVWAE